MTNSITVVRTLNMIASSQHRFFSLLLTDVEVCHNHEISTLSVKACAHGKEVARATAFPCAQAFTTCLQWITLV